MLRIWLLAITVLLLAEDFQYLLKVENVALAHEAIEAYCDCEDSNDPEGKKDNEEEKKEEKKDEDRNSGTDAFLYQDFRLANTKFSDTYSFFLCFSHELESPPPEF